MISFRTIACIRGSSVLDGNTKRCHLLTRIGTNDRSQLRNVFTTVHLHTMRSVVSTLKALSQCSIHPLYTVHRLRTVMKRTFQKPDSSSAFKGNAIPLFSLQHFLSTNESQSLCILKLVHTLQGGTYTHCCSLGNQPEPPFASYYYKFTPRLDMVTTSCILGTSIPEDEHRQASLVLYLLENIFTE